MTSPMRGMIELQKKEEALCRVPSFFGGKSRKGEAEMEKMVRISEKMHNRIQEEKPKEMSQAEYVNMLLVRGMESLENQREILYKLRKMWTELHPYVPDARAAQKAKTPEELARYRDAESQRYMDLLTAGRKEKGEERNDGGTENREQGGGDSLASGTDEKKEERAAGAE